MTVAGEVVTNDVAPRRRLMVEVLGPRPSYFFSKEIRSILDGQATFDDHCMIVIYKNIA